MSNHTFFKDLESFDNFSGITESDHFKPAPADWYVVVTDVIGSTVAIDEGRYKDVNIIGVAAIACAHKAMPDIEFPFVFGGDGASFLFPPDYIENVEIELEALQALSVKKFNLELRACIIKVSELYALGSKLDVAKFEEKLDVAKYTLASGKSLGVFRGGGLALAESILKEPGNQYALTADASKTPDLDDLSCRWQPIPSRHGKIVSLLIITRKKNQAEAYRSVLAALEQLVGGSLDAVNPVNISKMKYKSLRQCLQEEVRYYKSAFSLAFLKKVLGILTTVLTFKFHMSILFDPEPYVTSMAEHSDYRKFDDALRMIIDCSDNQVEMIAKYLDEQHKAGELFYGLHLSDESLMTCYVQSVEAADHIHFIDGGNGGYAVASKQLKQQIMEAS